MVKSISVIEVAVAVTPRIKAFCCTRRSSQRSEIRPARYWSIFAA
jgi:hypothetical protein